MAALTQHFERAYALVQQNIQASGSSVKLPGERVAYYINTCTPGILDVQDLMETDRKEFLQMAYYSLLGTLPEETVLQRWQSKEGMSDWEYRKAVLDSLLQNPEMAAKGRVIRNNIYADMDVGQAQVGRNLKQRLLAMGYRVSRRLPLGIKVPLKKLVLKLLMK